MSKPRPKGLGRGLEALLGGDEPQPRRPRDSADGRRCCRSRDLQPGRYQPRTRMDESALQDLAASIRTTA